MKGKITYTLLLVISVLYFFSGCIKNETCLSANNLLMTEVYSIEIDTTLEQDTTFVATSIETFTLFIVGREDSILYDQAQNIKAFSIPLSDVDEDLKIVAKINDGIDTIYLKYRPYSVFRSTECGVINRYEIQEMTFTTNKILDLYIENKDIDENEAVNVYLLVDAE